MDINLSADISEYFLKDLKNCQLDDISFEKYINNTIVLDYRHALIILERDMIDHVDILFKAKISENDILIALEKFFMNEQIHHYTINILHDYLDYLSMNEFQRGKIQTIISKMNNTTFRDIFLKFL